MTMRLNQISRIARLTAGVFLILSIGQTIAWSGTATGVTGLYYTGVNGTGGLAADGTTDKHWTVSYASIGGVENTTYQGAAYVIGTPAGGWAANTSNAQWITAPGNGGSPALPGNGTSGANAASYVYTLAFNIDGTGKIGDAVTNSVSITLTLAADDLAKIYVNPTLNTDGSINSASSTLAGSLTTGTPWTNYSAITLSNIDPPGPATGNANFKIGTNYLVIQVDNTNSQSNASGSASLNPTGLLFYQTSSTVATIDGKPVIPEVGTWLPVVGALGLFCWRRSSLLKKKSVA